MIPWTLPSHSKKPLQPGHLKRPSDKPIAHSAQGRLATHVHWATHLAGQRMSSCYKSDLRCASLSAFESGIFCLLFFAVEKKSVAEGIEGNKRCCRAKRLRRATPDLYGTSVPHSSLMRGRIRTNKNQIGIRRGTSPAKSPQAPVPVRAPGSCFFKTTYQAEHNIRIPLGAVNLRAAPMRRRMGNK